MTKQKSKTNSNQQEANQNFSTNSYFDQFKKNTEQMKEAFSGNMFSAWQENQTNIASQMQQSLNSSMKKATTLLDHSAEYCSTYVDRCSKAISQSVEQASNTNSLISEGNAEAARIAAQSFSCRTPEDCRNWAQDLMNSVAELAQQCLVTSAQNAVDVQAAIAKPLHQQALSLQESYIRACYEANPFTNWLNSAR